ncbi:MAG: GyrI-like domain-containing protein [Rhizobium sp.]|nr:GyrI-like domain-containing protein [Rhizobium sp.]
MTDYPIETWTGRPFAFLARSVTMPEMAATMGATLAAVAAAFARMGAPMEGPAFCRYTAFDGETVAFEAGFAARPQDCDALRTAGMSIGETPSGRVMTGWHIGPYDTVPATYEAMQASMRAAGVSGTESMWEAYHSPPDTPPVETRTQVIWPLA